jgi:hypothetical protein
MAAPGETYLVYTMAGEPVELDLSRESGSFAVAWLDSASGEMRGAKEPAAAGKVVVLAPPSAGTKRPWVAWLTRQAR